MEPDYHFINHVIVQNWRNFSKQTLFCLIR